ncbi:MAG: alpha/beta fold hydrolase [Myxococcota bacterium]
MVTSNSGLSPLRFAGKAGLLLRPSSVDAVSYGVLICGPVGHEAIRSHWAQQQIARGLMREGYPVLRFDYRGEGDSDGDSAEVTLAQWTEDVADAVQELRDEAAVRRVGIVGYRLGALLAALAIDEHALRIKDFVWWDPWVSGKDFVHQLEALHLQMLDDEARFRFSLRRHLHRRFPRFVPPVERSRSDERLGFRYAPRLRADLEAAAVEGSALARVRRHVLVQSEPSDQVVELERLLGERTPEVVRAEPAGLWGALSEIENAVVAGTAQAVMVDLLSRKGRSHG